MGLCLSISALNSLCRRGSVRLLQMGSGSQVSLTMIPTAFSISLLVRRAQHRILISLMFSQ